MSEGMFSRVGGRVGRGRRFLVNQGNVWAYCVRLLEKNRASEVAASLAYSTIFGLIPFAVIVLLVFQFLPGYEDMGDRARDFIYTQMNLTAVEYTVPDTEETLLLTDHLDQIIDRVVEGIDTGALTVLSLAVVIVAALVLLFTIERAFNKIYHVTHSRNLIHRMVNYWAVLTLGPVIIGIGLYVTTQYLAVNYIEDTLLLNIGSQVVTYVFTVAVLFLLYFVLPNTSVQLSAALWGAAIAALAWMITRWLFGIYVTEFLPYHEIYGAVGLFPLGIFWIYVTWLIVLFGLQLTFTVQHLKSLTEADVKAAKKKRDYFLANDMTVIGIVREIAEWFEQQKGPAGLESICTKLDIPAEFGEKIAAGLVDAGILAEASEPRHGYLPARDPSDILLSDIAEVLDSAGFGQHVMEKSDTLRQISDSERQVLKNHTVRDILSIKEPTKPKEEQLDS